MIENHRSPASLQALRFRIVKTAMFLFAREGIKPITMDRIAKELQISKRTLYEIFNDKEELLLEGVRVFRDIMNRYIDRLAENIDNVVELMLTVYKFRLNEMQFVIPRFYLDMQKYPSVVRFMRECSERETGDFLAFMQRGVEQGLLRSDVNFEVVHRVMFNQVDFIVKNMQPEKFPLVELFNSFILVCIRGFSTEKGLQQIENFMAQWGDRQAPFSDALCDYWPDTPEEVPVRVEK